MKLPTEKQVKCVGRICRELYLPMPKFSFDAYRKFISEHIEESREHEINRKFDRLMRGMAKSAWKDIDL